MNLSPHVRLGGKEIEGDVDVRGGLAGWSFLSLGCLREARGDGARIRYGERREERRRWKRWEVRVVEVKRGVVRRSSLC